MQKLERTAQAMLMHSTVQQKCNKVLTAYGTPVACHWLLLSIALLVPDVSVERKTFAI